MIGNIKTAYSQGIRETSSTARERVGAVRIDALGRTFRYAKNGATALAAGKVTQGPAATANHINCNVAAAAIGDTLVSLTVGATEVTENQYEGGLLQINDGTGEGHSYLIASNTACDASGTTTLLLEEPLMVALVASGTTEASLIPSAWAGVAVSTTEENVPAGVPLVAVPASHYCWLQTGGIANVLMDGTPAVGTLLTFSGTAAGALAALMIDADAAADYAQTMPIVGKQYATAGVDTEYKPVYLMID